ncbi:hypothetical protein PVW51_17315 [Sulfitobacter sp. PR48]|uniref:hypothetical protein n=1 Tax=Sulfitobacter sp. PR48 TaxID=3028383 RepID=UPI00237C1647|nr:hypothetical protein [Sulfitobacter sp. PR48]MDD9722466.1 hypothetical protein [Sulfitobacter sp. PR48]
MTIRRSVTAAACLLMAAAGFARAATLYECDLRTRIHNGWVSPKMAFVFEDDGRAKVIDGITLAFLDGSAEAKVTRRGDNLRINWTVANARDDAGNYIPTFRYLANLNTATRAVSVVAKPAAYPQRWSARGSCKIRDKR